ncbi:MAG: rhomboid family intramembrane serine protease [Paracoccaceae bacterium]|nr:rhomboid family intramembrane serine protease [Paracoccaceae bacterium]
MFPIRDHNPSGRTPYVTYALIALNVMVFLGYWLTITDDRALNWFFASWGLVPAQVSGGMGWSGFLSSMFLHGGWMHLAGNMLFLWIFGDNLEDIMGHLRYGLFYLACGLAAAFAQVAMDPASHVPMVGASGAIAGVMGGYLLLFPRARVDVLIIFVIFFRILPIPAAVMLGLWFALQLFSGYATSADGGGVAYAAHVGGFVAGLALTLPFWLARGGPAFWARTHGVPPHPMAQYPLAKSHIPTVRRK